MTLQLPPLPEMLRVACKVGGMEAVQALSEVFGGRKVIIPNHCGDDHPLVQTAGRAVADALSDRWGGMQLEFPRGVPALRVWFAATLLKDGATLNDLVTELRITHRRARQLKKKIERGEVTVAKKAGAKRDPRQIDIEDLLKPKPPK